MKLKTLIIIALSCPALALSQTYNPNARQDYATVTNVTTLTENRIVGQNCSLPVQPEQRSNTGAVLGGLGGAILGSQVGRGTGRVAGAAVGAATGAIVGDRMDNRPATHCTDVVQQVIKGYSYTASYHGNLVSGVTNRPVSVGSLVRVNVVTSVTPAE